MHILSRGKSTSRNLEVRNNMIVWRLQNNLVFLKHKLRGKLLRHPIKHFFLTDALPMRNHMICTRKALIKKKKKTTRVGKKVENLEPS